MQPSSHSGPASRETTPTAGTALVADNIEISVEDIAGLPRGIRLPSSAQQLVTLIRSDLLHPEVAALLMNPDTFNRHLLLRPEYEGLTLASIDAIVLRSAAQAPEGGAGRLPHFARSSGKGDLLFDVDPSREVMGQLRAAMRALLAQPPLDMDFRPTPLAQHLLVSGGLPASIIEGTRRRASWQDQDFQIFSGARSVITALPEPIVVRHPVWGPVVYRFDKTKAIVRKGGILQPTGEEQYRRPDGGEVERPDLDADGRYVSRPQNNPNGGLTAPAAVNDADFCARAWNAGLTLDLPLEAGVCRARQSRGEPLGSVSYLLPDDERSSGFERVFEEELLQPVWPLLDRSSLGIDRRAITRLQEMGGLDGIRFGMHKLFMDYGRLLDACDSAGIAWRYPHFGNVKRHLAAGQQRLFCKDFTAALDIRGEPLERQVGYRALTLALTLEHLPQLKPFNDLDLQMQLMQMLAFNPYTSLLMGYFSDRLGDPRLYMGRLPEDGSCNPANARRILDLGLETPVHQINLPEIDLLWDKVRRTPSPAPNVPPPAVFFCERGVALQQGIPEGVPVPQFEALLLQFMPLGVSWVRITEMGHDMRASLETQEYSLRLTVPEGLYPAQFGRVVIALMSSALAELRSQVRSRSAK